VTTKELLRKVIKRLAKLKYIILLGGILFAILLFFYAQKLPTTYSAKSTVFPLTTGADNNSATSKITELLGGNKSTKTISDEANVNIEEVGRSKKTREAVVAEKLSEYNNKTIAEILIDQYNNTKAFYKPTIKKPTTETDLIITGADLIKDFYSVKFNKNNLLELVFSNTDEKLVPLISYKLIDKISQFYIALKVEKAKTDLDFIELKLDSIEKIITDYDKERIVLSRTTLFTPPNRLKYSIPRENLEADKIRITLQRNAAASNREDALYRLQKVTPIIKILDRPTPPYDFAKPSKIVYAVGGFILGCIFFTFVFIGGLLYKYVNHQIKNSIEVQLSDEKTM
jgi:uncharacterized protein involved in exopolysaccharide biosynthesis